MTWINILENFLYVSILKEAKGGIWLIAQYKSVTIYESNSKDISLEKNTIGTKTLQVYLHQCWYTHTHIIPKLEEIQLSHRLVYYASGKITIII